jgi:HlyD family secretion protein
MLPPVKSRASRRLWWIRPRMILFVILAGLVAAFAADRIWIRGNGIVSGRLTAISPIVQARLDHLLVNCLDHVKKGQQLAEFRNEETAEAAAQQLLQLQLELTRARAESFIADRQAAAAQKLVDAQQALYQQQVRVLQAEDELVKKQVVALLVWQQAKAAVDRAAAEASAAQFVYETKRADQKKADLDADVLQKRIASYVSSPELTGHFFLTAPTDGIVTECTAQQGEVISAHTPIFSLFNPNDIYAVVFFDPDDAAKLSRGESFDVTIGGLKTPVKATLTDFFPELSALPSSLTRYFWQQEKWSQYAPVRLDFKNLTDPQRDKLFAWSQLSASRSEPPEAWKWLRRQAASLWPVSNARTAQLPEAP